MTRGEIWWIDFGLAFPGMPQGRRPGLVVQNTFFNEMKCTPKVDMYPFYWTKVKGVFLCLFQNCPPICRTY